MIRFFLKAFPTNFIIAVFFFQKPPTVFMVLPYVIFTKKHMINIAATVKVEAAREDQNSH